MHFEQNIERLQLRIAQGSRDPAEFRQLAEELESNGDPEGAITIYRAALELDLDDVQRARIMTDLGCSLYAAGYDIGAEDLEDEVSRLLSDKEDTLEVRLVRFYLHALLSYTVFDPGQAYNDTAIRSALELGERVIDDEVPTNERPLVYYQLAQLYNFANEFQKARALCERALQGSLKIEERAGFLLSLAEALHGMGRSDEAVDIVRQGLELATQPDGNLKVVLPSLYLQLGIIQRSQGELAEALETLQGAADLIPDDSIHPPELLNGLHLELGALFYDLGKYEEAAAAFTVVLRVNSRDDPGRRYALLTIGRSQLSLGREEEAKQHFAELLKSPYASDDDRREIDAALVFHAAKSHYDAGMYQEAASLFEDLLGSQEEGGSDQVETLYWLGHSFYGSGKHDAARRCYQQMLESPSADDEQVLDAKEALRRLSDC